MWKQNAVLKSIPSVEFVGWASIPMPIGCKNVAGGSVRMCKPPERTVVVSIRETLVAGKSMGKDFGAE